MHQRYISFTGCWHYLHAVMVITSASPAMVVTLLSTVRCNGLQVDLVLPDRAVRFFCNAVWQLVKFHYQIHPDEQLLYNKGDKIRRGPTFIHFSPLMGLIALKLWRACVTRLFCSCFTPVTSSDVMWWEECPQTVCLQTITAQKLQTKLQLAHTLVLLTIISFFS